MLIAVHYIGKKYTPGEVIQEAMPADKLEWLIKIGAVRETETDVQTAQVYEETGAVEDAQEEAEDREEPYEIDVMEGIVTNNKRSGRKKGGNAK